jgi:hypothetical protein
MSSSSPEFCLRVHDGKILIAPKGKPFFPEPLHKDVIILSPQEECFLLGPYPQFNTMIMPLNQYHKMLMELKNNCPNARSWRWTALVFMSMFIIMTGIYLQQSIFARNIFKHVVLWKKNP